jgi:hypothetical protein
VNVKQTSGVSDRTEGLNIIALARLIADGTVIQTTGNDGMVQYVNAPALPCPACGGSCYQMDADFEIVGLCAECGGSGIEGGC